MGRTSETSKMMQQLRFLVCECYDNVGGTVFETPKFYRLHKIEDSRRISLMLRITRLLMCTDYCSSATKIWLSYPYITMKGVRLELYKTSGELVNVSTIQSRIFYDSNKLCKDFTTSIVTDVCEVLSNPIDGYERKVSELGQKYFGETILNDVEISIKYGEACDTKDITDETFNEFMEIIYPYIKRVREATENALDSKVCYYVNMLVTGECKNEKDKERLEQLKEFINGHN